MGRARSWCTQFQVLLQRSLLAQLRNPTDVSARLLLSCWVGLVAGAPWTLATPCMLTVLHLCSPAAYARALWLIEPPSCNQSIISGASSDSCNPLPAHACAIKLVLKVLCFLVPVSHHTAHMADEPFAGCIASTRQPLWSLCAGLIFYDLPETPGAIFQRLSTLFFLVLLCAPLAKVPGGCGACKPAVLERMMVQQALVTCMCVLVWLADVLCMLMSEGHVPDMFGVRHLHGTAPQQCHQRCL